MNKPINKEKAHPDIGKQKFRVRNHYTCWVEYDVVANSKEEAEDIVRDEGGIEKIEWAEGYHNDEPVEVYCNDYNFDGEADSDYEKYGREDRVRKIEECVPYEDQNIDTHEYEDNYEDPEWTTDSYRWVKNDEDDSSSNTNNEKVESKNEIPF